MAEAPVARLTAHLVVKAASAALDVGERDIMSDARFPHVVRARHACWWIIRALTTDSFDVIGEQFGKEHSTVMHGVEMTDLRRADDAEFAATLDAIAETVRQLVERSDLRLRSMGARATDSMAAARRVAQGNTMRAASTLTLLEIAAMAHRLIALDEIVSTVVALLGSIDQFAALDPVYSTEDRIRARDLKPRVEALTDTLSSALASLGYSQEDNDGHSEEHVEEKDRSDRSAGAAVA